jgi:hypothetical protein
MGITFRELNKLSVNFCNICLLADPDGKIFKDLWNVGTSYLDNKFYFFEVTSSKYIGSLVTINSDLKAPLM